MSQPARTWRINRRALVVVAVVSAAAVGLPLIWGLAGPAGGRSMMAQAEALVKGGKPDLALHYLAKYLEAHPDDVEALDLQSSLMADEARSADALLGAVAATDQLLRRGGAPESRGGLQSTRRRIVGLYLRVGDAAPAAAQLGTAETVAQQLVDQSKKDKGAGLPGDLRLWARVKAALAARENDRDRLAKAIEGFEEARALDPKDVEGAERLARLYRDQAEEPAKGARVLDQLVAANPSAPAYLAVYRYHSGAAGPAGEVASADAAAAATEALRRAEAKAPDDPEVLFASAEDAQRRGDAAGARRQLGRLPERTRSEPRVRFLRGLVELTDGRPEEALKAWRKGLVDSRGNDADLTLRTAFLLLQLGRVDEAEPLIGQFRRLSGGDEPSPLWRLLVGMRALKRHRPAAALAELAAVRKKAGGLMPHQVAFLMAEAHEQLRDEPMAVQEYRNAVRAAPKWSPPRLALVRLLRPRQPEQADAELKLGLTAAPDDPALLLTKARVELQGQLRRIQQKREPAWDDFRATLERARKVAPASAELAVLEADYLAALGRPDEALGVLEKANRLHKTSLALWLARARLLIGRGRYDDARLALEQAAAPEAAGDNADLRILAARLKTRQGHGREAREELVRDLDRLPADQRPRVWQELGSLLAGQKDREGARKAYRRWAELLPDDPIPRLYLLDLALAEGDERAIERGIRELKGEADGGGAGRDVGSLFYRIAQALDLIRARPGDGGDRARARLEQAKEVIDTIRADAPEQRYAYELEGRYWDRLAAIEPDRRDEAEQRAADAYGRALEHEGSAQAVQRLVVLLTRLKRFDKLGELSREHGETVPDLDRRAAEVAAALGDKDQAVRLAEQVYKLNPNDLDATVFLARVLKTVGEPDKAERALKALAGQHRGELLPWLALLQFQAGRRDFAGARATADAIRANVKQFNKNPEDDRLEFLYAQCYRVAGQLAEASALYDAAVARWPGEPIVARGAAEFFAQSGRPDKAQKCLEEVVRRDPSQRWASRELALLVSAGSGTAAGWARAYDLVGPPTSADTPEDRYVRAVVLSRGPEPGQRKQAIETLEQLVNDLPASLPTAARARAVLGPLYVADGRPGEAAALARVDATAAEASPGAVAAYIEALVRAEDWDEADAQIDRLAKMLPGDLAAPKLRATVLAARGKPEEAAAVLEKAFAEHRDGPGGEAAGRELAVRLIQLKQDDAAGRVAAATAEKWPRQSWLLGSVLARKGQRLRALDLYLATVNLGDPSTTREAAREAVALVTASGHDPDEMARADAVLEAALAREPESGELLSRTAFLRHFQGRYDDEMALYARIMKLHPGDVSYLNNMAWTLSEGLKKPDEALKRINALLDRVGSSSSQFLDTRGVIYVRLGKFDEAIRDLEAAVRDRPSGTYYAHLALAYHEAGRDEQFREARDAARKAGLKPEQLDPCERPELEKLLFDES